MKMMQMTLCNDIVKFPNKSEETNQNPSGGFLIAHFKRYAKTVTYLKNRNSKRL